MSLPPAEELRRLRLQVPLHVHPAHFGITATLIYATPALTSLRGGNFGPGGYSAIYDNFTTNGQTWTVTSVFSNNVMDAGLNTAITTAQWSIRTGVSEGNGGTVVASGTDPATVTATGRSGFSGTEYQVLVTGLNVNLPPLPAGEFYFLDVVPVVDLAVFGQSFESTTSGANCVGTPCGNDGNSWWDSNFFGVIFTRYNCYLWGRHLGPVHGREWHCGL